MADITMCKGDNCPFKETCYRYKAVPSELYQSYFTVIPWDGLKVCTFYWNIKNG